MSESEDILNKVGISIRGINNEILPVNDILISLAGKFSGLSKEMQQNIGVTLAGRWQLNRFLALMQGMPLAIEATETALNSQGSAVRENAKYLQSLQARINKMKTAWQETSLAMGDAVITNSLINLITAAEKVAKFFTKVIDTIGLLPVVLGTAGVAVTMLSTSFRGLMVAIGQTIGGILGIPVAATTAAAATGVLTAAIGALKTSMRTLFITAGPVGFVLAGVGLLVEGLMHTFTKSKKSVEDYEEALTTLSDKSSFVKRLQELQKEYKELTSKVKLNTEEKIKLSKVENELKSKFEISIGLLGDETTAIEENNKAIERKLKLAKVDLEQRRKQAQIEYRSRESTIDRSIFEKLKRQRELANVLKEAEQKELEFQTLLNNKQVIDNSEGYFAKSRHERVFDPTNTSDMMKSVELDSLSKYLANQVSEIGKQLKSTTIELDQDLNISALNIKSRFGEFADSLKLSGVEIKDSTYALVDAFSLAAAKDNLKFTEKEIGTLINYFNSLEIKGIDDAAVAFDSLPNGIKLSTLSLAELQSTLLDLNFAGTGDELDGHNDEFEETSKIVNQTKDDLKLLNKTINEVSNGEKLSAEQLEELISLFPELIDYVDTSTESYAFESGALETVRQAKLDYLRDSKIAESGISSSVLDELASRLQAYGIELETIEDVAKAREIISQALEKDASSPKLKSDLEFLTGFDSLSELNALKSALEIQKKWSEIYKKIYEDRTYGAEELKDTQEDARKAIDSTTGEIKDLNKAIHTLSKGESLTNEEMDDLIRAFPQLTSKIDTTTEAYQFQEGALETLRGEKLDYYTKSILWEGGITEDIYDNLQKRLEYYGEEIDTIKDAASARKIAAGVISDEVASWKATNPSFMRNLPDEYIAQIVQSEEETKKLVDQINLLGELQEKAAARRALISSPTFGVDQDKDKDKKDTKDFISNVEARISAINKEANERKALNEKFSKQIDESNADKKYDDALRQTNTLYASQNKEIKLLTESMSELTKQRDNFENKSGYNMSGWLDSNGNESVQYIKLYNSSLKDTQDKLKDLMTEWKLWNQTVESNDASIKALTVSNKELKKSQKEIKENISAGKLAFTNTYLDKLDKQLQDITYSRSIAEKELAMLTEGTDEYIKKQEELAQLQQKEADFYKDQIVWIKGRLKDIKLEKAQIEALTNQLKTYESALLDVEAAIRDVAKARADSIREIESDIYGYMSDIADNIIDIYEEVKDAQVSSYDKQIEKIDEYIDLQERLTQIELDRIDRQENTDDYNANLSKLQGEEMDLQRQLNIALLNDDIKSKKRREELQKAIADKQKEISEFTHDREIELRKQSLQDRLETVKSEENAKKESLEEEKEFIEKFWDETTTREKYYAQLREQILKGSFEQVYKDFANFKTKLNADSSLIGQTITTEIINKMITMESQISRTMGTLGSLMSQLGTSFQTIADKLKEGLGKTLDEILEKIGKVLGADIVADAKANATVKEEKLGPPPLPENSSTTTGNKPLYGPKSDNDGAYNIIRDGKYTTVTGKSPLLWETGGNIVSVYRRNTVNSDDTRFPMGDYMTGQTATTTTTNTGSSSGGSSSSNNNSSNTSGNSGTTTTPKLTQQMETVYVYKNAMGQTYETTTNLEANGGQLQGTWKFSSTYQRVKTAHTGAEVEPGTDPVATAIHKSLNLNDNEKLFKLLDNEVVTQPDNVDLKKFDSDMMKHYMSKINVMDLIPKINPMTGLQSLMSSMKLPNFDMITPKLAGSSGETHLHVNIENFNGTKREYDAFEDRLMNFLDRRGVK